jgi:hypothetical protein
MSQLCQSDPSDQTDQLLQCHQIHRESRLHQSALSHQVRHLVQPVPAGLSIQLCQLLQAVLLVQASQQFRHHHVLLLLHHQLVRVVRLLR